MQKTILIFIFFLVHLNVFSQIDDVNKISISIVMPENVEGLNTANLSKLQGKVLQMLTNNGIGATGFNHNFVIYPMYEIYETKSIEGGMENLTMLNSQLNLYIKNIKSNLVFSSLNKSLVGIGKDKQQALTNAISKINITDKDIQAFIDGAKTKIISYYASNCEDFIRIADSYIQRQQYDQSIALLFSIPKEVSCYQKAITKSVEAYKAYQNQKCSEQILTAKSEIATNNFNAALRVLSQIDPSTVCSREADALIKQIEPKIDAIERERVQRRNKLYNDAFELEKQRIEAAKEIAKAYYNKTQPSYNYMYIIK